MVHYCKCFDFKVSLLVVIERFCTKFCLWIHTLKWPYYNTLDNGFPGWVYNIHEQHLWLIGWFFVANASEISREILTFNSSPVREIITTMKLKYLHEASTRCRRHKTFILRHRRCDEVSQSVGHASFFGLVVIFEGKEAWTSLSGIFYFAALWLGS